VLRLRGVYGGPEGVYTAGRNGYGGMYVYGGPEGQLLGVGRAAERSGSRA
ncbi:hypothetical protein BDZ91DRAFT_730507, partial [Kalaharituber pfeilii]